MPVCTGVLAEEELRLKWITAASHPSPPAVEGVCRVPGEGRTPVDRGGVRTVDRQALAGSTPGCAGIVALWTSDDAGATWRRSSQGLPIDCTHAASVDWCPSFTGYAADPFDGRRRWVARSGYPFEPELFLSEDAGANWHTVSTQLSEIFTLAADPNVRDRLLAGTFTGLFESEDGGQH